MQRTWGNDGEPINGYAQCDGCVSAAQLMLGRWQTSSQTVGSGVIGMLRIRKGGLQIHHINARSAAMMPLVLSYCCIDVASAPHHCRGAYALQAWMAEHVARPVR